MNFVDEMAMRHTCNIATWTITFKQLESGEEKYLQDEQKMRRNGFINSLEDILERFG